MATNISYVLKHKSKFFDTFLNDLQTVSKEYQKRLKKVGILRVKQWKKLWVEVPLYLSNFFQPLTAQGHCGEWNLTSTVNLPVKIQNTNTFFSKTVAPSASTPMIPLESRRKYIKTRSLNILVQMIAHLPRFDQKVPRQQKIDWCFFLAWLYLQLTYILQVRLVHYICWSPFKLEFLVTHLT